jgi:TonB family protein
MHDFPTLLIQAQDELARARKREAFWMSLFAHAVLLLLILTFPKYEKYLPQSIVMRVRPAANPHKELTFLAAPPDTQKVERPQTDKMSDKNRIAMSKQPRLDRDQLKKLLDASRAGLPNPPAPQPAPAAPPQQSAQSTVPQQQAPPQEQPAPAPPQVAKLQTPPAAQKPTFSTQGMSAGKAIEQAARAAAESHTKYAGNAGDLGLGQRQSTARVGPTEILSDTQGVDFGPYLQQVQQIVKRNWYPLVPESAESPLYKKGKVYIVFTILRDGQVAGMHYVSSSGDVALDRAAYAGISASNPFPSLPREFSGPSLTLQFDFFYNLKTDGSEIE